MFIAPDGRPFTRKNWSSVDRETFPFFPSAAWQMPARLLDELFLVERLFYFIFLFSPLLF